MKICLSNHDQRGIIAPALIVLTVTGLLIFFLIAFGATFKNSRLNSIYKKATSNAAATDCSNVSAGHSCLYLSPSAKIIGTNQTFLVQVRVNTNDDTINQVEAIINYPVDRLAVDAIDETNSDFPLRIFQNDANGVITIKRGTAGTFLTGDNLVVTLTFRTKTVQSDAVVDFSTNSKVTSSGGNIDILENTNQGIFKVSDSIAPSDATLFLTTDLKNYEAGTDIPIILRTRTDTDAANLFVAKFHFDPTQLQVQRIETSASFVTQWADNFYDNTTGDVSLIGGVPNPGLKTPGKDALMATIIMRAVDPRVVVLALNSKSAVYRNSDNVNILVPSNYLSFNVIPSTAASPSPGASGSGSSPSPEASANGGNENSPSPAASTGGGSEQDGGSESSPIPDPSAGGSTGDCKITSANWNIASKLAGVTIEQAISGLVVKATGNCSGKQVQFEVRQDMGSGTSAAVNFNPVPNTLNSGTATSAWVSEYHQNAAADPPAYYFLANVAGDSGKVRSSDPEIKVNQATSGTYKKGDSNHDDETDLEDLSIILSDWDKISDFAAESDVNDDDQVNAFDFSGMVLILKEHNILH